MKNTHQHDNDMGYTDNDQSQQQLASSKDDQSHPTSMREARQVLKDIQHQFLLKKRKMNGTPNSNLWKQLQAECLSTLQQQNSTPPPQLQDHHSSIEPTRFSLCKYALLLGVELGNVKECWSRLHFIASPPIPALVSVACYALIQSKDMIGAREVVETYFVEGGYLDDSLLPAYIRALVEMEDFEYALNLITYSYTFTQESLKTEVEEYVRDAKSKWMAREAKRQKKSILRDIKKKGAVDELELGSATLKKDSLDVDAEDHQDASKSIPANEHENANVNDDKAAKGIQVEKSKDAIVKPTFLIPTREKKSSSRLDKLKSALLQLPLPWIIFIVTTLFWMILRHRRDKLGQFLRFCEGRLISTYKMATSIH